MGGISQQPVDPAAPLCLAPSSLLEKLALTIKKHAPAPMFKQAAKKFKIITRNLEKKQKNQNKTKKKIRQKNKKKRTRMSPRRYSPSGSKMLE